MLSFVLATWLLGQSPLPPPAPSGCPSAQGRQFDFWLGDWVVYAKGEIAGTNLVTREFDGCVIQERWTSLRQRYSGSSFNHYDPARDRWHQTWVDSSGALLLLDGGWRDGRMVLEGERTSAGVKIRDRISFQPMGDGLRQVWETSRDGGTQWSVVFDGTYVKRGSKPLGAAGP